MAVEAGAAAAELGTAVPGQAVKVDDAAPACDAPAMGDTANPAAGSAAEATEAAKAPEAPEAPEAPAALTVHCKEQCKYCHMAKDFLKENNIPFTEDKLDPEAEDYQTRRQALIDRTQQTTFPWVFVGDEFVGGYTELMHAYNTGHLKALLAKIGIEIEEADF